MGRLITLTPVAFYALVILSAFGVLSIASALAVLGLVAAHHNDPGAVGLRTTIFGGDEPTSIPVADTAAVRAAVRDHVQGLG